MKMSDFSNESINSSFYLFLKIMYRSRTKRENGMKLTVTTQTMQFEVDVIGFVRSQNGARRAEVQIRCAGFDFYLSAEEASRVAGEILGIASNALENLRRFDAK